MNTYSSAVLSHNQSADDLITQNVDLVKRIAHHLIARMPSNIDVDDLMQSGMVGLLEAANNFDPSRGASFETYAGIRIRGSMIDDIRKHDWTPRSVHHKYRKVSQAISSIENELGRPARSEEIANRLDITVDEYHRILADSSSSRLLSLEESLDDPNLLRLSPKSASETPEQEFSRSQFREQLAEHIRQLPERERMVLSLYYEQELNLKEIGQVLDVSESRVCQIHGQAMLRLRSAVSKA
jgi:RNA polymerase sigma factor for flagellar operon FliA